MNARQLIPGLVILAVCSSLSLAFISVENRGTWPSDWPEELEPYRERAETARGPVGNDAAYYSIPFLDRSDFEKAWPALLKVKTEGAPVTLRSTSAGSAMVWVVRWLSPGRQAGLAIDLYVDGTVIDLNRIRLRDHTPIIDQRQSAPSQDQAGTQPPGVHTNSDVAKEGNGGAEQSPPALNEGDMAIEIEAVIDGRDHLVIQGGTIQWRHYDWAIVGRHEPLNEPTVISTRKPDIVTLDRVEWFPEWYDLQGSPVSHYRQPAVSSKFKELTPPLPSSDTRVILTPINCRGATRILQQPSAENDYTLIVEFDDNRQLGAVTYKICLTVTASARQKEESKSAKPRSTLGVQASSPLPHGGLWKVHWDLTLDGRVEGGTIRTFRLDLANNQIRAYFAGEDSQYNTQDRWWHGEVVTGRTPVIVLQRDDVGGYAAMHLLRRTKPGHFLGTWVDNLGHAGDIELELKGLVSSARSGARETEAALSVDIDPRRLSFIHAVRVLRETAPLMRSAPASQLPCLYAAMIQHIAIGQLPPRDNRINPRVVKKKMSNFAKKRVEHYNLPQPQRPFEQSVVILK